MSYDEDALRPTSDPWRTQTQVGAAGSQENRGGSQQGEPGVAEDAAAARTSSRQADWLELARRELMKLMVVRAHAAIQSDARRDQRGPLRQGRRRRTIAANGGFGKDNYFS